MGFLDTVKRVGLGVSTGGGSELYGVVSGRDPVKDAEAYVKGGGTPGLVWNAAKGVYEKAAGSLYPDAPPNAADTPAGKAASDQAEELRKKFNAMPAPTYGSAGSVPVSAPVAPTPPSQADYYAASGGTAGGTAPGALPPSGATAGGQGVTAGGYIPYAPGTAPTARSGIEHFVTGPSTGGPSGVPGTAPAGAPPAAAAPSSATSDQAAAQARIDDYNRKQAEYEKAKADYEAIYGGKAATANSDISASTISASKADYAPGFQAPQIDKAPEAAGAGMIDPNKLPLTTAQAITAPDAIKAGTVTATTIGPQRQDEVADISQDSLGRRAQEEALARYRAVADGTAPSAAQALLRQGIDENVGAQLGIAATLQGNNPGMALRSGLSGAANAIAKSSSTMAALRAQEQETGRAGFLTAATGIRTGDIDIAQSNQTKDLTTAANNLQANVDILKANQAAALRAGEVNVANDLQAQIQNASNQLETAKANAVNALNSDIANLTATLDASKANQATQLATNIANLNAKVQTLTANLQAAVSVGNANEANRVQVAISDANRQLEADKANQQALLDAAKARALENQFNAGQMNLTDRQKRDIAASAATSNADRDLRQQEVNNNLYTGMGQLTNNALGLPLGVAQSDINNRAAANRANASTTASLIGTGLSTAGKFFGS